MNRYRSNFKIIGNVLETAIARLKYLARCSNRVAYKMGHYGKVNSMSDTSQLFFAYRLFCDKVLGNVRFLLLFFL
jgi:hypothetical protein